MAEQSSLAATQGRVNREVTQAPRTVSPSVAKADNGLKGQLARGARRRLKR